MIRQYKTSQRYYLDGTGHRVDHNVNTTEQLTEYTIKKLNRTGHRVDHNANSTEQVTE